MNKKLSVLVDKLNTVSKSKVKRSSKICSALKIRFLEMLQDEGTTIKYVNIFFNSGRKAPWDQLLDSKGDSQREQALAEG